MGSEMCIRDSNKGAIFIQHRSCGTYQTVEAVEKDIILLAKERKNDMIELEYSTNTRSTAMYIIICLDDNNGLAFNHRRQSQDRIVAEDISKTVGEKKLWITDYSRKLFQAVSNLEISENPKEEAKEGEYVFQELETLDTGDKRIEQFIIYRWNRVYPADVSVEIGTEWKLTETEEFPGFSHEKITKEVYCRE